MDLFKKLIVALSVIVLSGCVGLSSYKKVSLPDQLSNKGLFVAEIHYGDLLMYGKISIIINGSSRGNLQNGYATIPLEPGRYTLDRLEHKSKGSSSSYVGVTVTQINVREKNINREFEIKPGKVTNLGLIVFSPDNENEYFIFDNTKEIKAYLKHQYPELSANLRDDDFMLGEGALSSRSIINALRKKIANSPQIYSRTSMVGIFGEEPPGEKYISGPLGILAKLNSKNGKIINTSPLALDTIAPVVCGSSFDNKVTVLTGDDRVYMVENGTLSNIVIPVDLHPVAIHLFKQNGIALVNGRGKIVTSQDNGKTWTPHTTPMPEIEKDLKDIQFAGHNGKNGFYLYSRHENGTPPIIFYTPYDHLHFSPIELPDGLNEIDTFWSKDSGLFIGLGPNVFSNQKFYYQAHGTDTWVQRSMPGTSCTFGFKDAAGRVLTTKCYGWQRFSKDMGITWENVPGQR